MKRAFSKFSSKVSQVTGSPYAFIIALSTVVIWAVNGPVFHFSTTWQLAINTTTTIVTFLMVFLIQNSQNRDTKAIHLKLDELIRVTQNASDKFLNAEELSDDELEGHHLKFKARFEKYEQELAKRRMKSGSELS